MALKGIAFPFRKEKGEFPKTVKNEELVSNNLIALFNTPVRRRVMRPQIGTTAQDLLFEPLGPILNARLERSIRRTILDGEPRARVISIETSIDNTLLSALVTYEVNGVRKTANLQMNGG